MNRSLRAAGAVLAIGAVLTTVMAGIAVFDQRATDGHSDHAGETAVVEPAVTWKQLEVSLDAIDSRVDDVSQQLANESESARRGQVELESRLRDDLRAELDRGLAGIFGDTRLVETIESTLASRGDRQQIESIEARLKVLAGTIERQADSTAALREQLGRLQPAMQVVATPGRPEHFTIEARQVPLADVLKRLDELSDWKFEATMAATARVSIDRLEGVTIQQALEVLLPAAGCAARLDGRKVNVMSMAEARRQQQRRQAVPAPVSEPSGDTSREVIVDLAIVSIELTDEYPGGISDLIETTGPTGALGQATGGLLDQPISEFLEQLGKVVSTKVVAQPRLRVNDGAVARLETGQRTRTASMVSPTGRPTTLDLAAKLVVRPRILPGGQIELSLTPTQETRVAGDKDLPAARSAAEPSASIRVVIPAGQTVLLGGLFADINLESAEALERGPEKPRLIERLFGDEAQPVGGGTIRRELIVLATPRLDDRNADQPVRQSRP
ncbi:MAG: type II and III secretion system protein [Planctomycetales bacterium]|nr:type II and III secretion system protein [Planctomycetales bacterium]